MQLEIRSEARHRYAYLVHEGPYPEIGATFDRLFGLVGEAGLMPVVGRSIGLYLNDPSQVAPQDLRSHAGFLVPDALPLPAGLEEGWIPESRTAVGLHQGSYARMQEGWMATYDAIRAQGLMPDGHPYEVYLNDPSDTAEPDLRTEIHVPLA